MAHQKTYNAVILLLMLLLFFGCKKLSKEYTTARWEIINPVTNTPYVGIPVRLILADNRGSSPEYETIWQGETNAQGIAEYNFKAYMHTSFSYLEQAHLAVSGVGGIDYSIIRRPSVVGMDKNEVNELRYEIVPYTDYVQHTKNIDCQGPNDKMRLRRKFLYTGKGENNFSAWIPNLQSNGIEYLEGCYDNMSSVMNIPSDSILYEIEVIKNGSTETFYQTFFVGSGQVDTVKIYY
jgi:hypothetical protein